MIAHKTFHRYVVRAKRGTAQSSRDSQGNAPKSAGASLRRYNEAALTKVILYCFKFLYYIFVDLFVVDL